MAKQVKRRIDRSGGQIKAQRLVGNKWINEFTFNLPLSSPIWINNKAVKLGDATDQELLDWARP